ncbi:hypothetical protein STENM223S_03482 [Streptomyces tendae]
MCWSRRVPDGRVVRGDGPLVHFARGAAGARAGEPARPVGAGDALGSQFFVPVNYPLLKRRELPEGPWQWTDDSRSGRCAARHSSMNIGASTAISRPMGTLTKSTHRQSSHSAEHAARDQTDGAATRRDRGEDAEGAVGRAPPGTGWSMGASERRRCASRRPCPGRDAPGEATHHGLLGHPAEHREAAVTAMAIAAHEDVAPAEDVAGPAAEEQQSAEGQGVGADHPGEIGGAELQGILDVRERDVHNRRVEYDHEFDRPAMTASAIPGRPCRAAPGLGSWSKGEVVTMGPPRYGLVNERVHCCVNRRSPRQ